MIIVDLSIPELLKAQVEVVAALGELVATVTEPCKDVWPLLYPESLHADLWKLAWTLWDTLRQRGVTFLRHRGVTPMSRAVAALMATPGPIQTDVTLMDSAWRVWVYKLEDSWSCVFYDALDILDTLKGEDTAEATNRDPAQATATGLAGDLRDETPPGRGTAGDSLVAAAPQPSVALPSAGAAHDAPVGTGQGGAAARRQRMKKARELLERLIKVCGEAKAWLFPWDLDDWLYIEATWEGREEVFPNDLQEMADDADKFEELCDASARLARRHLLGTLRDIQRLLSSPCGGSGGPGGPIGRAVAERCQRAIEDIPRLLGGQ